MVIGQYFLTGVFICLVVGRSAARKRETDNENIITIRTISYAVLVHDTTATALDLPDTVFDVGMIDSESIDTVTSGQKTLEDKDNKHDEHTKTSLSSEKQMEELHESEDENNLILKVQGTGKNKSKIILKKK